MTSSNVLLVHQQQSHLLSISRDASPENLQWVFTCCDELTTATVNTPDGMSEALLRVDCYYVYLLDYDQKQVRCWRNRDHNWFRPGTWPILRAQMTHEMDLSEYSPNLPSGWKSLSKRAKAFGVLPVATVRAVAVKWDQLWQQLNELNAKLSQLSGAELVHRLRTTLPITPLALPYRDPVCWQKRPVHYLTRDGIWLQTSAANQGLERVTLEQVPPQFLKRLFSRWLKSV